MSDSDHHDAPGSPAVVGDFQNQKAKELALLLQDDEASPYTHFAEARTGDGRDIVVIVVEPEVPQDPDRKSVV
jgi:hypothetical protein